MNIIWSSLERIFINNNKQYKNYVCPNCFEKINHCQCEKTPETLIMIDSKMQYAIKILNQKYYYTQACCEGHYNKHNLICTYIYFKRKINSCPIGWKKRGLGIYFDYNIKSKKDFAEQQKKAINNLNTWVDSL